MSMPLKVFSRKVCLRIGKTFCKPCDGIYLYVSVTYNWRPNRKILYSTMYWEQKYINELLSTTVGIYLTRK